MKLILNDSAAARIPVSKGLKEIKKTEKLQYYSSVQVIIPLLHSKFHED